MEAKARDLPCKGTVEITLALPDVLRSVAGEIERSLSRGQI
jgi:hypothetical protein